MNRSTAGRSTTSYGADPIRGYGTPIYRLPPEPPVGAIVVPYPDHGGPYWERDDLHPVKRWRQSKAGDHRSVTWGEVLFEAHGAVQILPSGTVRLV